MITSKQLCTRGPGPPPTDAATGKGLVGIELIKVIAVMPIYLIYNNILTYSLLYINIFLIFGCTTPTPEEHLREASSIIESLVTELQDVTSKEELIEKQVILKRLFNSLAKVMVHLQQEGIEAEEEELSLLLQQEMIRLYQIDGAQELVESYQKPALRTLAAYGIK